MKRDWRLDNTEKGLKNQHCNRPSRTLIHQHHKMTTVSCVVCCFRKGLRARELDFQTSTQRAHFASVPGLHGLAMSHLLSSPLFSQPEMQHFCFVYQRFNPFHAMLYDFDSLFLIPMSQELRYKPMFDEHLQPALHGWRSFCNYWQVNHWYGCVYETTD